MAQQNLDLYLNISEIFYSIQGEGTRAGLPCIFIRLQGCKLRCVWCDTKYALKFNSGGKIMTLSEIISEVEKYNCKFIEFTGGEPLEQGNIHLLINYFLKKNYEIAIETAGYLDVSKLDSRVIKIMDLKCPDSAMNKFNLFSNIDYLTNRDEIKFVISSKRDYEWAKSVISEYSLFDKCAAILFSPVQIITKSKEIETNENEEFSNQEEKFSNLLLAEWILQDNLPVRFQLQIHKYIWDPEKRGV